MNEQAPAFLSARWLHLAMLNYEVDEAVLRRLVPAGTELDVWNGKCFVSMVGFQFQRTRVLGLTLPGHHDFDEVNLRFYVKREAAGELRRGVVFVKEIVPRRTIAWLANWLYHEKYVALPMSHQDTLSAQAGHLEYRWRFGDRSCRLRLGVSGAAAQPPPGSEAEFITEHYWGYTARRDGSTLEYQVEHPRWNVWPGIEPEFDCDVRGLYGDAFAPYLAGAPSSCFVADGSEILVRRGRLCPPHPAPR